MKVNSAAMILAVLLCALNAHAQGPCLTVVKEGTTFNRAEIEGAMKRQGIKAIVNPIAIK